MDPAHVATRELHRATVPEPTPVVERQDTAPEVSKAPSDWSTLKNKPQRIAMLDEQFAEIQRLKAEASEYLAAKGFGQVVSRAEAIEPLLEGGLHIHINTILSKPHDRLDVYIREICQEIEKQTGCKDIRMSDHSMLDFGKWKGALAAAVRENPLDDGVYVIDTKGNEIAEVVANTLIESAADWAKGY
jgi:hypothetical protein